MKKLLIEDLHLVAKERPHGYVENVLYYAKNITSTHYEISDADFQKLHDKYANTVGLGSVVSKGIDLASFGMAKPVATSIAKAFGASSCGCDARAKCLNELVPDVSKIKPVDWLWLAPRILKCIGASE